MPRVAQETQEQEIPAPKLPKGETPWMGYFNREGQRIFLLTSKERDRDWYYLYEVTNNTELKKFGRAHTPTELEEKYKVTEKMFA